jgi:plasmid stabilization system protein ParE
MDRERQSSRRIRDDRPNRGARPPSGDPWSRLGRPGLVEGTRELVEPPYIIVYRINEKREEITVLGIVHGAQNR